MLRALFEKTGNAAYISHLDLMRVFQRSFKRAGLPLTHTKGFNPRPSVSIALPMSLGVESVCELLDFELEAEGFSFEEIRDRLNANLIDGVRILEVYDNGAKLKHLAYLSCDLVLEYDAGRPAGVEGCIRDLFKLPELIVEKKGKNGITEQNVILKAMICCQNPTLNPSQLVAAIEKYLPELAPDFVRICRREIYNTEKKLFR